MTLSEFILANLEPILVEWEAFAKTIPAASGMDTATLRDHAETILMAIAHDMVVAQTDAQQFEKSRGKGFRDESLGQTGAESHAADRQLATFDLNEMVSEYRALRASVIRLWRGEGSQAGGALYELTRFSEGIDQALTESVARFCSLRDQAIDLEKHHRNDLFIATLAHELRNPLAPLRNTVYWMRKNVAGRDGSAIVPVKTIAMMERQIGQMTRLLDDLLDIARIESGKLELRRERTEMASIVSNAVEASVVSADLHRVNIALPDMPIYIDADPARMTQVVSNLLNNAIKYSSDPSPIDVTVEWADDNVRLTVKDAGVGIALDKLEEIFEMFAQISRPLEPAKSGLGVGLTLAREIVEMHGGTIRASSEGFGCGSCFVVNLPALPRPFVIESEDLSEHVVTKKAILVADDNRDAADSMAMLLRIAGHEVHVVYDGAAAIAAAMTLKPDLVVLDLAMPKMSGMEVAREIRHQDWVKPPTLVAVTGWGQHQDRQQSLAAGFDFHLVKPVELGALERALRH